MSHALLKFPDSAPQAATHDTQARAVAIADAVERELQQGTRRRFAAVITMPRQKVPGVREAFGTLMVALRFRIVHLVRH